MECKAGKGRVCFLDENSGQVFKIPKGLYQIQDSALDDTSIVSFLEKYQHPSSPEAINVKALIKNIKENDILSKIYERSLRFSKKSDQGKFLRRAYLLCLKKYIHHLAFVELVCGVQENLSELECPEKLTHVINPVKESIAGIINISLIGEPVNISQEKFMSIKKEVFGERKLGHTFKSLENFKIFEGKVKVCDLGSFHNDMKNYQIQLSDLEQFLFLLHQEHSKIEPTP